MTREIRLTDSARRSQGERRNVRALTCTRPWGSRIKPVNSQDVDLALCEDTFKAASDQMLNGESLRFVHCQSRLTG